MSEHHYTLFVDESGDAGISQVRTENSKGASPYMTLGAVLVPNVLMEKIRGDLDAFRNKITKKDSFHCNNLGHENKVRFSEFLTQQRVVCFGVVSLKETLGKYKEDINSDSCFYYNKCAQYLLERLGIFLKENNIPKNKVSIIFEEGNFDYDKLKNLIRKCQNKQVHPNSKYLKRIDANQIYKKNKDEESLLELSDLVAHSLYRAIYGGEKNVFESRYLNNIKDKFFKRNATIIGNGIYTVHSVEHLNLPLEQKLYFKDL